MSGERSLCIELTDELHNERWGSFSCSNAQFSLTNAYISLEQLFQQWQTFASDPVAEREHMVFRIPDLMKYTLRLLDRERSFHSKETQRLLIVAKTFMPTEIYDALVEFEQSDADLGSLGAGFSKHEKFWQGYTGAESLIFIQALNLVWQDPFSYLNQPLLEVYEQKLQQADMKIGKLSPAVLRAEEIRKQYLKSLLVTQGCPLEFGGE